MTKKGETKKNKNRTSKRRKPSPPRKEIPKEADLSPIRPEKDFIRFPGDPPTPGQGLALGVGPKLLPYSPVVTFKGPIAEPPIGRVKFKPTSKLTSLEQKMLDDLEVETSLYNTGFYKDNENPQSKIYSPVLNEMDRKLGGKKKRKTRRRMKKKRKTRKNMLPSNPASIPE